MYWLINKGLYARPKRCSNAAFVRVLIPCAIILLFRCSTPQGDTNSLFAVDSMLHAQAIHLTEANAKLNKQTMLGTKREEVMTTPRDTTAWLKELEIFSVMDAINKPINRDRYQVTEAGDLKSNLRVRSFTTSHDLAISYVRLYYYNELNKIRKIEAAYTELNGLYKTSRALTLEFADINGTPIITSYSIIGGQKMFMDDTVQYDIKGRVSLEN